jgi:hypothetical protein
MSAQLTSREPIITDATIRAASTARETSNHNDRSRFGRRTVATLEAAGEEVAVVVTYLSAAAARRAA